MCNVTRDKHKTYIWPLLNYFSSTTDVIAPEAIEGMR